MQFKEEIVPLSAINTSDSYYQITTTTSVEDLMTSIEVVGLLHLPVLCCESTGYRIVYGFRRIHACQKLGWSDIKAKVLKPETSGVECVKLAVTDNSSQRSLNLIELSRSVRLLRSVIKDDTVLLNTAAQLGLPNNLSVLKKAEILSDLPGPVQEGVLSGSISLSMALTLASLDENDAIGFAHIFNHLKPSLNKQREILTLAQEIVARENISIRQLLNEIEIKEGVDSNTIDRGTQTRKLRQYLHQRRFPEIDRAKTILANRIKKLNLGSNIQLIPPKNLEGPNYTLRLDFNSLTDLKDHQTTLVELIQNQDLATILKE